MNNNEIKETVENSINDLFLKIQNELNIKTGDFASYHFSGQGEELQTKLVEYFQDYSEKEKALIENDKHDYAVELCDLIIEKWDKSTGWSIGYEGGGALTIVCDDTEIYATPFWDNDNNMTSIPVQIPDADGNEPTCVDVPCHFVGDDLRHDVTHYIAVMAKWLDDVNVGNISIR